MEDEYQQAVSTLMNRLPMFARQGARAIKFGLRNIKDLCTALNNPELQFKSLHVAGTNGKGSTSHILAATCQKAGLKTGLYTSPHLVDIRERVRIDGKMMSKVDFIDFVKIAEPLIEQFSPSYFELNVAMAFWYFAKEKVDIAVIETGLGGRMDSTNIIIPELSVITNIGLDHTDVLGDTLAEIAVEKAGIIKHGVDVVIGESNAETTQVFLAKAAEEHSALIFADQCFELVSNSSTATESQLILRDLIHEKNYELSTDMAASFQQKNIMTSWAAVRTLAKNGWPLDDDIFLAALRGVKSATGLRGRWDWAKPNIVLDVAHNPDGIAQLLPNIASISGKIKILYGSVRDKDVAGVVAQLPKDAEYFISAAAVPRAMPVAELSLIFEQAQIQFITYESVAEAMRSILSTLLASETLIIMGSFFVVGEAYAFLDEL